MSHRKLTFGFTTLAAALALASAAYACTTFKGKSAIVVDGVDQSEVVGDKRSRMTYCTGLPVGASITSVTGGNVITFRATPASNVGGCPPSQMPNFTDWRLTTVPGTWTPASQGDPNNVSKDCMASRLTAPNPNPALVDISRTDIGPGYQTVNGLIVAEAGAPTGTAQSVPHTFSPGSHMVCLSPAAWPGGGGPAPPSAPMNKVNVI